MSRGVERQAAVLGARAELVPYSGLLLLWCALWSPACGSDERRAETAEPQAGTGASQATAGAAPAGTMANVGAAGLAPLGGLEGQAGLAAAAAGGSIDASIGSAGADSAAPDLDGGVLDAEGIPSSHCGWLLQPVVSSSPPPGSAGLLALDVDAQGQVMVSGHTYVEGSGTLGFVAKLEGSDGRSLWTRQLDFPLLEAEAVRVDGAGDVIVAGFGWLGSDRGDRAFVTKLAGADGATRWTQNFGHEGLQTRAFHQARAVDVDSVGDVYVAGYAEQELYGESPWNPYLTAFVTKVSGQDGQRVWNHQFEVGGQRRDWATSVVVVGQTLFVGGSAGTTGVFVRKQATDDGSEIWLRTIEGEFVGRIVRVAVDSDGDVLVAATAGDGEEGFTESEGDFFVSKLSGADGSTIWSEQLGGDMQERVWSLALDERDDLLVAGHAVVDERFGGHTVDRDAFVAKLSGDTGSHQWTAQFGSSGLDDIKALCLGPQGQLLLGGESSLDLGSDAGLGGSFVRCTAPTQAAVTQL